MNNRQTQKAAARQIGWMPFFITTTMVIGLESLFRHLSGDLATPLWQKLGLTGGLRLIQIAIVWVVLNQDGDASHRLGLKQGAINKGVLHGLFWVFGFGVCVALGLIFATINHWPWANLVKTAIPQSPLGVGLFWVVGGIISPIAEELLFRGIVYGFFRRWGFGMALVISTALFVAAHGADAVWIVPLVGGIVFAVSYEWSRSLAAPILIHVAGNLAIFGLSWILN